MCNYAIAIHIIIWIVEQLLVHDNQLVDEQSLIQMNPDVCRKEIGVTILAHSGIQCSLANTHCMFSDARTVDMQERCLLCGGSQSTVKVSHWVSKMYS